MDSQKQDFGLLSKMLSSISLFKYGAFFGLVLFCIEAFWVWRDQKNTDKEKEAMRHENNVLKAKVYDLTNSTPNPVKPNVTSK
jgi:putative Ca2+/H+ antiporter (TMEM165/GDT1 family)